MASDHESNPGPPDDPVTHAYRAGIDLSLIRKNLTLGVEERIRQLMAMQALADELERARSGS